MAERRGHPVVGRRILLATLAVVVVVAGVGAVSLGMYFSDEVFFPSDWRGLLVIGTVCLGVALVVLVLGLWIARQVRLGRWGLRRGCPACGRRAEERLERCPFCGEDLLRRGGYGPLPHWRVAGAGTDLTRAIDGEPIRRLEAGTVVSEVRRIEGHLFVVTAEGSTGWLAADRLETTEDKGTGR